MQTEIKYPDYFECVEFNGNVYFLSFGLKISVLGKFGLKNQNRQFELKFGTVTNWNMQNSMMVFTLVLLDWKY